jgi:CCR4-NOT transcription complex subunit 6
MADGFYGLYQGGGPRYNSSQHPQNLHHQARLNRTNSPISVNRGHFSDLPSPTHSPRPVSPGHNQYGMFNQNQTHPGGHNMMMNGPSGQRYNMQLNIAHKFGQAQQAQQAQQGVSSQQLQSQGHQQQQQHHHHVQQQQHQPQQSQQQSQQEHGHAALGHQHSFSSSGLTNSHFGQNNAQNGAGGSGGVKQESTVHWQLQQQLAAESRLSNAGSHYFARQYASQNKASTTLQPSATPANELEDDRPRASNTSESPSTPRQEWQKLDLGGQGLRALNSSFFRYAFLETVFLNNNKLTKIPAAIGKLRNLSHLDLSNNQLSELPPEIGMLSRLKKLYLVDNNLHTLPYEIGYLYQIEVLAIEGNPLSDDIKTEIVQNGVKDFILWLRENAPVTLPPPQRDWLVLDESPDIGEMERFTVMTYNTLGFKYATSQQYRYTPTHALSWDYRKELILREMREHNADFICQQEIDAENFQEYFRPSLAYNDYKGVHWARSKSKTMAEKEARQVDGCAIYYKSNK